LLKQHGPSLKRPLAGEITTSKIKNMKELRPGSTGRSQIRILFVFDPGQQIVLLAAGSETGVAGTAERYRGPSICMQNILRRWDGWRLDRQSGSHRQFRHPKRAGTVTAGKLGDDVPSGTSASICRQAGWSGGESRWLSTSR